MRKVLENTKWKEIYHINIQTVKLVQSFLLDYKFSSEFPLSQTQNKKYVHYMNHFLCNEDGYYWMLAPREVLFWAIH